jgi:uncharacterized SAM-binding protein YcdF (DUF218 family)
MTPAGSRSILRRRWKSLVLGLAVTSVVTAAVQRESLLARAGRWLDISAPLDSQVDYVMVLGGEATSRPFVAAEIMRVGLAKQVLIPQTTESAEVHDGIFHPEHKLVRQVLLRSGISDDAIVFLDGTVDSTAGESQSLAVFLNLHPGVDVAVVTSDFHTRRTRLLFSRACGQRAGRLCFIGAPTDGFDASNWWRFEEGFKVYFNEYLKLVRALAWSR